MKTFLLLSSVLIGSCGYAQEPANAVSVEQTLPDTVSRDPEGLSPFRLSVVNLTTEQPDRIVPFTDEHHQFTEVVAVDTRRVAFPTTCSIYNGDVISSGGPSPLLPEDHTNYLVFLTIDPLVCTKKAMKRQLPLFTAAGETICVEYTVSACTEINATVRSGDDEYTFRRGETVSKRQFDGDRLQLELFFSKGKCIKAIEYDPSGKMVTTIFYKEGQESGRKEKPVGED